MHNIDLTLVEMTMDIMKFAIARITATNPELGFPKKEEELLALAGETITPTGISGENAFGLFRDVLLKASISPDHPRHLAFVPASPTRAAVMFDLVTSASSVHGAYLLEGADLYFRGKSGNEMACFIDRITRRRIRCIHQRRNRSKSVSNGGSPRTLAKSRRKQTIRTWNYYY